MNVAELLRSLSASGVDVLYSSELVPPSLDAAESAPGPDLMSRVVAALAVHHLMLRPAGPGQYVVTRAPVPPGQAAAAEPANAKPPRDTSRDAPLEALTVFASRYEFTGTSGEPFEFDGRQFDQIPGAKEDAMRALRTAPGFATNLSARPYVRGALLDDVLIEFDGIPVADPFHFRNFQSVISAFDPSSISRAEVFTGGFPVKYGTRSGAVIDLAPRSIDSGYEYSIGASRLGYDFDSVGRAERWPIEWLVGARLSGDESALPPPQDEQGQPKYSDLIGRIGWTPNATSSLTLGWLALDDRVRLVSKSSQQQATARSRDVNAWLKWDWTPGANIKSETSLVVANTERYDNGDLDLPDIAVGSLSAERSFSNVTLLNRWTVFPSPATSWDFGGELTRESADLSFSRVEALANPIALDFGRSADATISSIQTPHSSTLGIFASFHRRWRSFEAEAGMRFDGQAYDGFGARSQLSPRINMRYDPTDNWHAYASWGEFTQAQRVDEYRAEDNQVTPDSANRATHLIVGVAHGNPGAVFWRLEAYRNYWSTISPYYDNAINETSLLPQLQPDRELIVPSHAEAAGIELSAQRSFEHGLTTWALFSASTATDEVGGQDIPRSWDQRRAANLGFAWSQPRTSASVLLGWHSGWPLTPLSWIPGAAGSPAELAVGARNSARWGDYFSVDLRLAASVPLRRGVLSLWFDATNVTNRPNECCFELNSAPAAAGPSATAYKTWSPRVINAGFTWLVRRPQ